MTGQPDFDPTLLEPVLGGPVRLTAIDGGQSNPTWFVACKGRDLVLRKKPLGATVNSAHAIEREYRVIAALQNSPVPVPRLVMFESDPNVIGTEFYLMERIDGTVSDSTDLPGLSTAERHMVHLDAARILANLHRQDIIALGLEDFGRSSAYYNRQVHRWREQWRALEAREDARIDALADWFARNIPPENPTAIVHGDYRIGNLILAREPARVAGVLDWELSTLGDPLADLAHWSMFYDLRPDQMGGLAGLDLKALGLPGRSEFLDVYRAAGGCPAPLGVFHRAFAMFRMAVILEGITARAEAGHAASVNARAVGALAPDFTHLAEVLLSTDKT